MSDKCSPLVTNQSGSAWAAGARITTSARRIVAQCRNDPPLLVGPHRTPALPDWLHHRRVWSPGRPHGGSVDSDTAESVHRADRYSLANYLATRGSLAGYSLLVRWLFGVRCSLCRQVFAGRGGRMALYERFALDSLDA